MWEEIKKHTIAYLCLLLLMAIFLGWIWYSWPNKVSERLGIVGLAVGYFCWGSITHVKSKKITIFVLQEYLAISLLGALLLLLLTF